MPMLIGSFKCPRCGGELAVPEGETQLYCQYCGAHLFFDDGTVRYHVTVHDDAGVYRAELERERLQLQKDLIEYKSRWVRQLFACAGLWMLAGLVMAALKDFDAPYPSVLWAVKVLLTLLWIALTFLGPIALFVKRPGKYVGKL